MTANRHPSQFASDERSNHILQSLHQEIQDYYSDSRSDTEVIRRRETIDRIKNFIETRHPRTTVEPFGSIVNGTYIRSSDIDVVVTVRRRRKCLIRPFKPEGWLEMLRGSLIEDGHQEYSTKKEEFMKKARVPLLKITDSETHLKLDISCRDSVEIHTGMRNSQWIQDRVHAYPSFPALTAVLKELLHQHNLDHASTGGICSYILSLMVLSFLQREDNTNECNLGVLLMRCLKLYGQDFDYETQAIVLVGKGLIISKDEMRKRLGSEPSPLLSIQQPLDPTMDAALPYEGGVRSVQRVLAQAYDRLTESIGKRVPAAGFLSAILQ